jgi:small GTP-binding protein
MAVHRRVAFVGPAGAGKTSIINRHIRGTPDVANPTVGYQFEPIATEYEGTEVVLDLFDTAGQERFRSLVTVHLRDADAVLIVFNVADADSLATVSDWNDLVLCHAPAAVVRVLVANKMDLGCAISRNAIEAACTAFSVGTMFMTSARTGDGVDSLFHWLVAAVMSRPEYRPPGLVAKENARVGCPC